MFNKIEVSMKKDQGLNFTICVALYQALKKMKVLIQKKKRKKLYRRFKLSRYYIKRKTTFTSHCVHMGKQKEGVAGLIIRKNKLATGILKFGCKEYLNSYVFSISIFDFNLFDGSFSKANLITMYYRLIAHFSLIYLS